MVFLVSGSNHSLAVVPCTTSGTDGQLPLAICLRVSDHCQIKPIGQRNVKAIAKTWKRNFVPLAHLMECPWATSANATPPLPSPSTKNRSEVPTVRCSAPPCLTSRPAVNWDDYSRPTIIWPLATPH